MSFESLRCTICLRMLFQPVTTSCGHSFCKNCLLQSMTLCKLCPLCRTPLVYTPDGITTAIDKYIRTSK